MAVNNIKQCVEKLVKLHITIKEQMEEAEKGREEGKKEKEEKGKEKEINKEQRGRSEANLQQGVSQPSQPVELTG